MIRLLGQGIAYSASPVMQTAALRHLGLAHRYELADVPADELAGAVAGLRTEEIVGANVTTPHKSAVVSLLDEVEPLARRAGAVNTIVRRDALLVGSNTDVPAIAEQIAALRPRPGNTIVLGAGGAAHAVALALEALDAERVTLVSRSPGPEVVPWAALAERLAAADLLINATPIGTGSSETPVPADQLHPGLTVLDLVYRPSPTRLVREARAAGAAARAGAGVLLGQGWRSLEAWIEVSVGQATKQAMADALRRELGEAADV